GMLSGLDLKTLDLFPVHGQRDTWGGLPAPPWAANEWHGPARGSAAISDDQLFWVTGSRVLCLRGGTKADGPPPKPHPAGDSPAPPKPLRPGDGSIDPALLVRDVPQTRTVPEEATRDLR